MLDSKQCNALSLVTYFYILEQMRNENIMSRFGEEDYDKLVEASLRYFTKFNNTKASFDGLQEKEGGAIGVRMLSKHHLGMVDFQEATGEQRIKHSELEKAEVLTALDVGITANNIEQEEEGEDGAIVTPSHALFPMGFKDLGVVLDYDRESLVLLPGGKAPEYYPIVQRIFLANDNKIIDMVTDTIKKAIGRNGGFDLEEGVRIYVNDSTFQQKIVDALIDKIEIIESSAPYSINGESLSAAYIEKKKVGDIIISSLKAAALEGTKNALEHRGQEHSEEGKGGAYAAIEGVLEKWAIEFGSEAAMRSVNILQQQEEGIITRITDNAQYRIAKLLDNASIVLLGNEDIITVHQERKDEGLVFSMRCKATSDVICTLPIMVSKKTSYSQIRIYAEQINENNPGIIEKIPVEADTIEMGVDLRRKVSFVKIASVKDDFVKPSYRRNDTMNYYLINQSIREDLDFGVMSLDEADRRAEGKFANCFRSLAKDSENIIIASGTPIAGKAKDIVAMLAYAGQMHTNEIEQNKSQFMKSCGISQIKSTLLSSVVYGISNGKFAQIIRSNFGNYQSEMDNDKSSTNIHSFLDKSIEHVIVPAMIEYDIVRKEDLDDMEFGREVLPLKMLYTKMMDLEKNNATSVGISELVLQAISDSHSLKKELPGINAPGTFVSLIKSFKGINPSIMSRTALTGLKEKITIQDLAEFKANFPRESGAVSEFSNEKFFENNRAGIRLLQSTIKEYRRESFLPQVLGFLSSNYSYFIDGITKSKQGIEAISSYLDYKRASVFPEGEAINASALVTFFGRSTKSATDDFPSLYKEYLQANGESSNAEVLRKISPQKLWVFEQMNQIFTSYMTDLELDEKNRAENPTKTRDFIVHFDDGNGFDCSRFKREYPESFKSINNTLNTDDLVHSLIAGYPEGFIFSTRVDLCPCEFDYIIRPNEMGERIGYNLVYSRDEEEDVLDTIGSLGLRSQVSDAIKNEQTAVVSSARTVGTLINLLTAIDAAIRSQRSADRKIDIILNLPNGTIGDETFGSIIKRIDDGVLRSNNIQLTQSLRSELDKELTNSLSKGYQTYLLSNYESVARGLDLSGLDIMIATGAMTKGRELVQFAARLFNPERQHIAVSMFNGGADALPFINNTDSKEELIEYVKNSFGGIESVTRSLLSGSDTLLIDNLFNYFEDPSSGKVFYRPSKSGAESDISIDKINVNGQFMNGEKSSITSVVGHSNQTKEIKDVFIPSESYRREIEVEAEYVLAVGGSEQSKEAAL